MNKGENNAKASFQPGLYKKRGKAVCYPSELFPQAQNLVLVLFLKVLRQFQCASKCRNCYIPFICIVFSSFSCFISVK